MRKFADPILSLIATISTLLFLTQACATKDRISPNEVTKQSPTYVMGEWYQCKKVEVKE